MYLLRSCWLFFSRSLAWIILFLLSRYPCWDLTAKSSSALFFLNVSKLLLRAESVIHPSPFSRDAICSFTLANFSASVGALQIFASSSPASFMLVVRLFHARSRIPTSSLISIVRRLVTSASLVMAYSDASRVFPDLSNAAICSYSDAVSRCMDLSISIIALTGSSLSRLN
ncbi:hypothetical protein MOMOMMO210B_19975 [Morganella morganii]